MTDGAGVPTGTPLTDPPLVEAISEDPVLRDTKLIAEAWDCDGLNQARFDRHRRSPACHAVRRGAAPTASAHSSASWRCQAHAGNADDLKYAGRWPCRLIMQANEP